MASMFDFGKQSEQSLKSLEQALIAAEEDGDFEVENASGALHISFDEPPAKFVISPNSAVNQIWISALSTSFKLDWSGEKSDFVLTKTGEALKPLVARLINQHLSSDTVSLD
jgi:iron donor protein CyaY